MSSPIWNGSSSFSIGQTPFGFYDTDTSFKNEVDKVAVWCATRLGYPQVNVELQSGSFYAALEEATTIYGNEVYQYKVRENYLSMEGNSTGSLFNNALITPSLGSTIRISKTYGTEAGSGGNVTWHTGSLSLTASVQEYDLNSWAQSQGITSPIEITRVFYEAPPAIVRYFDPYAGTGTGIQGLMESFGFGSMSPGISFMLMPIFFDVLKIQAIEFNDQIRKSSYSFEIHNNRLRIFPVPQADDFPLFFNYIKTSERDSVLTNDYTGNDSLITNISQVPYANPVYSQINAMGRMWIYQYALAISKEMLGYIRKKYSSIPIPGAEVTLNGDDLVAAAGKEKDALLQQLRDTLDQTSRKAQLERQSSESNAIKDQLTNVPLPIYVL